LPTLQYQRFHILILRSRVRITTPKPALFVALFVSFGVLSAAAAENAQSVPQDKEQLTQEVGMQAVVYGLPLVMMDITMKNFTNSPSPRGAPANQFVHERAFPPASYKQVVRLNVDTLYSSAFLDLTKEPIVMSVPETHGRYYLLPLMDAWSNVFATPGSRTRGDAAANFLIAGPNWTGSAPAGMQILKSPTNMAWLLGRTETHGPADYAAVREIQDGYRLTPLSRLAGAYTPPAAPLDPKYDAKTPPVEKLKAMSATQYFDVLARLLKANPPPDADAPMIAKLARIGIVPGKPFDPAQLEPAVAKSLDGSVSLALQRLQAAVAQLGATGSSKSTNGWRVPPMTVGSFGTNYQLRAVITLIAFGANLPADAVYPTAFVDGDGNILDGSHRYLLHFGKGATSEKA